MNIENAKELMLLTKIKKKLNTHDGTMAVKFR